MTVDTNVGDSIGACLDAARWQRQHTTILLALGAGWVFDSFEVKTFSNSVGPLGDHFGAGVAARDAVLAARRGGTDPARRPLDEVVEARV